MIVLCTGAVKHDQANPSTVMCTGSASGLFQLISILPAGYFGWYVVIVYLNCGVHGCVKRFRAFLSLILLDIFA